MNTEPVRISLSTVAGGRLEERFQLLFAELLENIRDPNTSKDVKRKLKIELTLAPAEDRQAAVVTYKLSGVPAPPTPVQSVVEIHRDGTGLVAVEHQRRPDPQQKLPNNVAPMREKEQGQ